VGVVFDCNVEQAVSATCFEASFVLIGVATGEYDAKIVTPWGASKPWRLTVVPQPVQPTPVDISVDEFDGDIAAALAHAASLPAARVLLGAKLYKLSATLVIPNRTALVGQGTHVTKLQFAIGDANNGKERCASHVYHGTDLYGSSIWRDVGYNNASTLASCCEACQKDPSCNAYQLDVAERHCQLKGCSLGSEASCVAHHGNNSDRTAAFLFPFRSTSPAASRAAVVANGIGWSLANFTLEVVSAPVKTKGVHSVGGRGFAISGLSIQLSQQNATSALHLEVAHDFSVSHTVLSQNSLCFWGCGAPGENASECSMHSANSDFPNSATLQMRAASWGHIHHNTISWKCSAFDMDVSSNVIFEDNNVSGTEAGVIPHGNSLSFYDWQTEPSAANWSFSHNALSRPAYNNHENWIFHESMTTDGPGGFGAGRLDAISDGGHTLTLGFDLAAPTANIIGASVMVCGGSGLGQRAVVAGKSFTSNASGRNSTVLHLVSPLNGHVSSGVNATSVLCLTPTIGSKLVSGNSFTWGMAVRWFGTTSRGVIADNSVVDCNVGIGEGGPQGAIQGWGLCYSGPQPIWDCEYTGNTMVRSNGIALTDNSLKGTPYENDSCNDTTYPGPFMRWQVIRRNSIAGVALSANQTRAPTSPCGTITMGGSKASTDVVIEGNQFDCPPGSVQPPIDVACDHCKVTP
jgi:hypothetical protein